MGSHMIKVQRVSSDGVNGNGQGQRRYKICFVNEDERNDGDGRIAPHRTISVDEPPQSSRMFPSTASPLIFPSNYNSSSHSSAMVPAKTRAMAPYHPHYNSIHPSSNSMVPRPRPRKVNVMVQAGKASDDDDDGACGDCCCGKGSKESDMAKKRRKWLNNILLLVAVIVLILAALLLFLTLAISTWGTLHIHFTIHSDDDDVDDGQE